MFANYQHVNIAPDLSIAENYFLGKVRKTKYGTVDWKKMDEESQVIVDKFKMDVNPLAKIKDLPIAMQAMVTISKISVNKDIKLVIFDEPTALLENEKVETLFQYIKELKSQGVSVIYISHRLEEIMDICDSCYNSERWYLRGYQANLSGDKGKSGLYDGRKRDV